jgi:hypothetical protein
MNEIGIGSYTRPPQQRAVGTLRSVIKASKRSTGVNLADLTVLAPANDPYRLDTAAGHRCAQWFADQLARFVSTRRADNPSEGPALPYCVRRDGPET